MKKSNNYLEGGIPKYSESREDTIWRESPNAAALHKSIVLDKLRAGKFVDESELRILPTIKPIDYAELKKTNPTLYVEYYDELRKRPTAKGWLAELYALKGNNENPYADVSKKVVQGSDQYKQIESWLADLNRTEEILIVSYENEDGKLVQETLNATNFVKGNVTRYSGINVPYTIELVDGQIDEAKAVLGDILESSYRHLGLRKDTSKDREPILTYTNGDTHERN